MTDNAPHPTPHPAALSARQAADRLGVNEKTIRRWIERGKLPAVKDNSGAYRIDPDAVVQAAAAVPHPAANRPQDSAAPAADRAADTPRGQAAPNAATPIDLQPLADLIERQGDEIRRLTEAATMWQYRARHLEEQLLQLTAGSPATEETAQNAPGGPETASGATDSAGLSPWSFAGASEPRETRRPSWWRRLLYGG